MGENKNVYRILVAKPQGKRPLGRTRRRWVDDDNNNNNNNNNEVELAQI
jgi:hypothetical protein